LSIEGPILHFGQHLPAILLLIHFTLKYISIIIRPQLALASLVNFGPAFGEYDVTGEMISQSSDQSRSQSMLVRGLCRGMPRYASK
jgi:hypothetical protein